MDKRLAFLWGIVLWSAVLLGFFSPPYYQSLLIFLFIYGTLALSYDIMGGLLGYMNLGIIIFYGVGAYVFALTINYLHSFLSELAVLFIAAASSSVAVCALVSLTLSYPLFRVKGFYFAVITLGLIGFVNLLVSSPELSPLTGGFSGISIKSQVTQYGSQLVSYFLALAVITIGAVVYVLVKNSSLGLFFSCIKEDEEASECTGINLFRVKQTAFIISSVLAGLAGVVYMWSQTYTNPRFVFSIDFAFLPITMALLGGSGTLVGSFIGAAIFTVVYQLLIVNMPSLTKSVIGLVLIGVGLGASHGLIGLSRKVFSRLQNIS
ncbi:MAG: branched-chain amino acid ABC transporter permease [Candidatus Caldarchaeum sp.]